MNNKQFEILDILAIISFILQVKNNDELEKQTTNDEIFKNLHQDIVSMIDDNRQLCNIIIKQNEKILKALKM